MIIRFQTQSVAELDAFEPFACEVRRLTFILSLLDAERETAILYPDFKGDS